MNIRGCHNENTGAVIRLWQDGGLVLPRNDPGRDIDRKLTVNPKWFPIGERDGRIIAGRTVA